MSSAYLVD